MNAVLMMPENEITSKLANHYRVVSGKAFKSIDTKEYEGENYICFTANSQADFIGGRCSSGKDQPFDKIPGIFETMMFDYAVDIAKYGQKYGVDYADVLVRNGDGNAQRGFNIDRDAVTFTGEVWDSNRFDAFWKVCDVREEMRDRAFSGEFSEDTRLYLSDEEASDILLKEQEADFD